MNFKLTVVAYHFIGEPLFSGLHTLTFEKFKQQLDRLQKEYSIIAWPQLSAFLEYGNGLPEKSCLLTFDDGTKDHNTAAKELSSRGLSGLFFILGRQPEAGLAFVHLVQYLTAKLGEDVLHEEFLKTCDQATRQLFFEKEKECLSVFPISKYDSLKFRTFKRVIGKFMFREARPIIVILFKKYIGDALEFGNNLYLTDKEICSMVAQGMHIGGHGVEHRWMTTLGFKEKENEIKGSAERIKRLYSKSYAFGYPYGDYDDTLFPILTKYSFIAAFTAKEKIEHQHKFIIYRSDTNALLQ